jgi:hypothetical protein
MKGLDLIPDDQIAALADRLSDMLKAKLLDTWREMLAEARNHDIKVTIERKT